MYTSARGGAGTGKFQDVYKALMAEMASASIAIKTAPSSSAAKICLNVFGFVSERLLLTAHSCDSQFYQQQLFYSDYLFGVTADAAGEITVKHLATIPFAEGSRRYQYYPTWDSSASKYVWNDDNYRTADVAVPLSMVRTAASGEFYTYLVFNHPINATAEAAALAAYNDYAVNSGGPTKQAEYEEERKRIILPTQLRLGVAQTTWAGGAATPTLKAPAPLDIGTFDPLLAGVEVIWSGPDRLVFAARTRTREDYNYDNCATQTTYSSYCFFVVQDPKLEFWSSWSSVKRYSKVYEMAYNTGTPALAMLLDFTASAFSGKVVTSLKVTIESDGVNIYYSGSDTTSGFALYGKRTGAGVAAPPTTVPYEGTPSFLVRVE
jgi:hypothetical protein